MEFELRIYIHDTHEFFECAYENKHTKKHLPLAKSLTDFLDLDLSFLPASINRLNRHRIHGSVQGQKEWMLEVQRFIESLGRRHVYFCAISKTLSEHFASLEPEAAAYDTLCSELEALYTRLQWMQQRIAGFLEHVLDADIGEPDLGKLLRQYFGGIEPQNVFAFAPQMLYFEEVERGIFEETLHPETPEEIAAFLLRACLKRRQLFRKCKNCGRYFPLTGHSNTEYCDRVCDESGKTCKEAGALYAWEKKIESNPILKAYSRAYKKRFAWIRYGKITKETFYDWAELARLKRERCLKGQISLEKYLEWLNE